MRRAEGRVRRSVGRPARRAVQVIRLGQSLLHRAVPSGFRLGSQQAEGLARGLVARRRIRDAVLPRGRRARGHAASHGRRPGERAVPGGAPRSRRRGRRGVHGGAVPFTVAARKRRRRLRDSAARECGHGGPKCARRCER